MPVMSWNISPLARTDSVPSGVLRTIRAELRRVSARARAFALRRVEGYDAADPARVSARSIIEEWFGEEPEVITSLLTDIITRQPDATWAFDRLTVTHTNKTPHPPGRSSGRLSRTAIIVR